MASPLFSSLLFIILASGAKAADKELGQDCTTTDNCVHPTLGLVCDVVARKCVIKHGQSCDGDGHSGLCVAGAECSTTCTCTSAIYSEDSGTGKCSVTGAKWGSACPDGNECTDDSLTCESGVCVCVENKKVVLSSGLCTVDVTASKVGRKCDAASDTTNCGAIATTHLACPSSGGTCFCQTGYTGTIGEACSAVSGTKVGLTCTSSGSQCGTQGTTHLTCQTSNCACENGYYGVPGGSCYVSAGKIGGGCSGTSGQKGSCSDNDALCMTTGQVMTCKRALGGACTADGDCSDTTTMVCDPTSNKCLIKVGQSCSGNTDKCVEGATCDNNVCTCKTDYKEKRDACSKKVTSVGASCKAFDTCSFASTNCDVLTGQCLLDVGASCTDNKDKCTTGATCSTSNTCSCGNGYTTSGTRCAAANGKPGGTCSSSIACTDANSECLNSVCVCKTGYKFKSDGATCEKDQDSGAVGVAASAVTVVLSAFFCPLFSLP